MGESDMSRIIIPKKTYMQHAVPDLLQVELSVIYTFEVNARVDAKSFSMSRGGIYNRLENDLMTAIAEWAKR